MGAQKVLSDEISDWCNRAEWADGLMHSDDVAWSAVIALRAAGYVIVPATPTTKMLCAADAARDDARNPLTDGEIYSAMLSAAKEEQ